MQKNRPLVILFGGILILSQGSSPLGQLVGSQSSLKPKATFVRPILPSPPNLASAPAGPPDQQVTYFADQLASGKNHPALWRGLDDALSVPLTGQDGKPLGGTGDDPVGPARLAHSLSVAAERYAR